MFDATGSESPPALQRKLQAEFMRQHQNSIRTLNLGTAFVIDSVVLRGALTAILWLQPLPCPHFVCPKSATRDAGCGGAWMLFGSRRHSKVAVCLMHEREAAQALGIPYARVSQACLLAVAHTKGESFKPAPGKSVDEVIHIDDW